MIPGICNVCGTTLYGSEVYSHFGRCIEARYGIRASRTAPKGRRRLSDRIVHISVILEFDRPSYRTGEAQERQLHRTLSGQSNWRKDYLTLVRA